MTSETTGKVIFAKSPNQMDRTGLVAVVGCWIFLYFWCITQLVDGVIEWLSFYDTPTVTRTVIEVATTVAAIIGALRSQLANLKKKTTAL